MHIGTRGAVTWQDDALPPLAGVTCLDAVTLSPKTAELNPHDVVGAHAGTSQGANLARIHAIVTLNGDRSHTAAVIRRAGAEVTRAHG